MRHIAARGVDCFIAGSHTTCIAGFQTIVSLTAATNLSASDWHCNWGSLGVGEDGLRVVRLGLGLDPGLGLETRVLRQTHTRATLLLSLSSPRVAGSVGGGVWGFGVPATISCCLCPLMWQAGYADGLVCCMCRYIYVAPR